MTPSITRSARRAWADLATRDFDAITDLMDALIDASETGIWGHVDVLAEIDTGYYRARAIRTGTIVVLVESERLEIFAIGRPDS